MTRVIPRVRLFAGPNGSGKSTLFRQILPPALQGVYLNPDEIERAIGALGYLDLRAHGVTGANESVLAFFAAAPLVKKAGLEAEVRRLRFSDDKVFFETGVVNAYLASVASDFIRNRLLAAKASFTFESVMSSPDKVDFLAKAQRAGYRTYLYYVATEDPIINVSRVRSRVALGGHHVPEEKIASRYHRSLALLPAAIRVSNRAYIFDNSGGKGEHTWLAEITDGRELELKADVIPAWFKRAVLDPLAGGATE